jgi:integrase
MNCLSELFTMFINRDEISEATRRKYYYRLRRFVALHGDALPSDITIDMLQAFIDEKPHLSDPSRSIMRQSFHAFFAFCGLGDENPAKGLQNWRSTPRRVVLPPEDAVRLALAEAVRMCNAENVVIVRDGLIFTLAVMSGNRRGEIRNLKVNDVLDALQHPVNGVCRVYTSGKTGEAVLRFLETHTPHILYYLRKRPMASEYVFVNLNPGHERYGRQLSLVAFDRARRRVCTRAGVGIITYQELRRRLATAIARSSGVDTAANVLNHSPYSGDRVIRLFYYDPDKAKADAAVVSVFGSVC